MPVPAGGMADTSCLPMRGDHARRFRIQAYFLLRAYITAAVQAVAH